MHALVCSYYEASADVPQDAGYENENIDNADWYNDGQRIPFGTPIGVRWESWVGCIEDRVVGQVVNAIIHFSLDWGSGSLRRGLKKNLKLLETTRMIFNKKCISV